MGVYGCVLVGWLVVVGWLVWVAGGYMKCTLVGMVGLVSIALAMAAADAAAPMPPLVAARDVSSRELHAAVLCPSPS